jgi:hypothetical protein
MLYSKWFKKFIPNYSKFTYIKTLRKLLSLKSLMMDVFFDKIIIQNFLKLVIL